MPRTIAETLRSAELERQWAATDESNSSSPGYYPRWLSRGARREHGAAMHHRAQDGWSRAMDLEAAAAALQRLLDVIGAT